MAASAARIAANQANALKSTGPRTAEGKDRSRANALKHGMTGEGVVLPHEDAAEVERRFAAFRAELQPTGEVDLTLVRRAATLAVRMERCVAQETAALAERVRRAEAEFEAPEGADLATADRLRAEAMSRATFDPSREATLARRYEAAAERGFFRALKELRQVGRASRAADPALVAGALREALGSFGQGGKMAAEVEARAPRVAPATPPNPSRPVAPASPPASASRIDVPFTIGRHR